MTSDPTTPDAVERQYQDSDGNPCDLVTLCRREPEWAANRITTLLAERARHAEEVARLEAEAEDHCDVTASLRDQLRRTEGERDVSRRQCGELHEHLALIVRYFEEETSEGDGIADQHWAGYQLAKIVLVRTAPNEAAWETAMVEFAQLQERASRVLGLSAALDDARHELDALRALLPDVRACAEYCRHILIGPPGIPALAARRILAAIDQKETPTP